MDLTKIKTAIETITAAYGRIKISHEAIGNDMAVIDVNMAIINGEAGDTDLPVDDDDNSVDDSNSVDEKWKDSLPSGGRWNPDGFANAGGSLGHSSTMIFPQDIKLENVISLKAYAADGTFLSNFRHHMLDKTGGRTRTQWITDPSGGNAAYGWPKPTHLKLKLKQPVWGGTTIIVRLDDPKKTLTVDYPYSNKIPYRVES